DRGVPARTVAQLARHSAALEEALAAGRLPRLARRHPRLRGLAGLADDVAGVARVLLQPVAQLVVQHLLREGARLGVAELGLGLPLELRLAELDRDNGGQPLANVLAGEVVLLLLEQVLLARVPVDERGERGAEALFAGAAPGRVERAPVGA